MSYGNSYSYAPGFGRGRGNGHGNEQLVPSQAYGHANENHVPEDLYGHGMPQQGAPGQAFYHVQEMARRPLQNVQLENMQYYSHAQSLERLPAYGRGFGAPSGYAPCSQGLYRQPGQQDADMRFAGPAGPAPRHFPGHPGHPQEAPMAGRHGVHGYAADAPLAGPGHPGANMGYCETPPSMYSGFTPPYTSTPVTTNGEGPVTDTICTSMSTGRGYVVPSSRAPAQQPGASQTSAAGAVVAIWARPTPRVQQPSSENSRVVAIRTSASNHAAPPSRSTTSPMLAEASADSRPRQQQGKFVYGPVALQAAAMDLERGTRVITGFVESVLSWGRKLEEEARPHILFEIVGSLDSVVRGHWFSSQMVCLRSLEANKNATISTIFFEVDAPLSPPPLGSAVSCLCRLAPKWSSRTLQEVPQRRMPRMQVLKLRALSADQVGRYKRVAYVSSHAVAQASLTAAGNAFATAEQQAAGRATPAPLKQSLITTHLSSRPARP